MDGEAEKCTKTAPLCISFIHYVQMTHNSTCTELASSSPSMDWPAHLHISIRAVVRLGAWFQVWSVEDRQGEIKESL